MISLKKALRATLCIALFSPLTLVHAEDVTWQNAEPISEADVISILWEMPADIRESSRATRTVWISSKIVEMNIPYGSVCGEGPTGDFQQGPMASLSAMDCVTYVEPVLALASVTNFEEPGMWFSEFQENLVQIRYRDPNNISFGTRNHFPTLDWLPHLSSVSLLTDVTKDVDPDASIRRVWTSKRVWFGSKDTPDLQLFPEMAETVDRYALFQRVRGFGEHIPDQWAEMNYIAIDALLDTDSGIVDQIFEAAGSNIVIFNMVRGDHRKVPIPVVVGHQGFLVRTEEGVFFRHATNMNMFGKKVTDVAYRQYLEELDEWKLWPILGFSFYRIEDNS